MQPGALVLGAREPAASAAGSRDIAAESGDRIMMTVGWILLGLVGWAFGLMIVLTLFRMAGDQDRAARHEQKRLDPYSDVTITHTGEG